MENKEETPEKWYEKRAYIIALCCSGGVTIGYPFGLYQLCNSIKFKQIEKISLTVGPLIAQLISFSNALNK